MTNVETPGPRERPSDRPTVDVGASGIALPEGKSAVAQGERLGDYLGSLLLIQPLQTETWDTSMGEAVVLVSYVLVVNEGGGFRDLGETPIFWNAVKQTVIEATNETQRWTVGVLSKGKRAFFLNPPTPEQAVTAGNALAAWQQAQAIAASTAGGEDEESF
jgi:hypothetical protein